MEKILFRHPHSKREVEVEAVPEKMAAVMNEGYEQVREEKKPEVTPQVALADPAQRHEQPARVEE